MKINNSILYSLFSILLLPKATAGPVQGLYQLTDGLREVIRILIQFISETILQIDAFNEFLFAKLLLFTLILLVVYTVISKNGIFGGEKNKTIQWIISSAISILAIRYLPNNFIQAIMLQYGAFAVGITVFLPLIIYFFFVQQSGIGPFGRKTAWIVYLAGFFALWSFRYEDLGEANWIYWIAIGFIIISMIFDKTIHKHLGLRSIKKIRNENRTERRVSAEAKLKEIEDRRQFYTNKEYQKAKDRWEKAIKDNLPK